MDTRYHLKTEEAHTVDGKLQGIHSLRSPKLSILRFHGARFIIRLIQKICENIKTIMIYLKYI
jgi:hypothetical protein